MVVSRVVVVGNEKGGVGKTTIAANIASLAARTGYDTLLVDADPGQQSSVRWASRRRDARPAPTQVGCVSLTARDIRHDLSDLARRYQMIVVDTGAEDSPQFRAAATVAHCLVIPLQPDPFDVWTLPGMGALYLRARDLNPDLRVAIALNRIPFQLAASAGAEVRAWIHENVPAFSGAPIAEIVSRAAFGRASGEGLGVAELARRDPRAEAEIARLFRMVLP